MKFTQEQKTVIELENGQHLVLAPAGTGKTEVLVERVISGISKGLNQKKMACLTFTNQASYNMKDRISQKMEKEPQLFIGNIHHFCTLFLKKYRVIPQTSSLLDVEDVQNILAELIYSENTTAHELLKLNNFLKGKKLNIPEKLLETPKSDYFAFQDICDNYEKIKLESNFIDFDDLLLLTYKLLADNPQINNIFSWLQIDEVQDLNFLQWAIIEKISDKQTAHRVFFGDYEQAIFSFMGAKIEILEKINQESEIHFFIDNFRSPSYLLDIFNRYAKENLSPKWKEIPQSQIQSKKNSDSIQLQSFDNENDEVDWIVKNISNQKNSAILVRTNKSADKFAKALENENIDFFKISGFDLFHRKEVKNLMAFLTILIRSNHRISWIRIFSIFSKVKSLTTSREIINRIYNLGFQPLDFIENRENHLEDFVSDFENERIVVFDTETTGLDFDKNHIIQIAGIEIIGGKIGKSCEIYLKTEKDISESQKIHNISKEYLDEFGEDRVSGFQKFLEFISDSHLIAHNLYFDWNMLNSNLKELELDKPKTQHFYDTLEISQRIYPNLKSYKLSHLLKTLEIEGKNSHNAMDDVKATVNLVTHLIERIRNIKQQRFEFYFQNQNLMADFSNQFSPIYNAVKGRFSDDISLVEIVNMVFGYMENLTNYQFDKSILIEVENKLLKHMKETCKIEKLIDSLNENIPKYSRFKESDLISNSVNLVIITIHKAKGLEFETVVIPNVNDNEFPSFFAKKDNDLLEDAKVLYVGMTRAKKNLWLTFSKSGSRWNKRQELSRFLTPINWQEVFGAN